MSKANVRFEKLNFTAQTLKDCKKAKLSESIAKGLSHRYTVSAIVAAVLLVLFSGGGWYLATNKASLMEQVNEGADILYYGLLTGISGFVVLFTYGLMRDILNYINVAKETIISVDVDLSEIHYKITANRTNQPYLRVKNYNIAPIGGLTDKKEVFDEGIAYRFYFTKRSKVFLAVEEKKVHKK